MFRPTLTTLVPLAFMFVTAAAGCDKTEASPGAAASKDSPAAPEADGGQPAVEIDPLVAEALESTKKDIAEVRAGLAKQSMAESLVCSDVHRRLPKVKLHDAELAAEAVQVCDYDRPLSELDWTISQVEAEIEENAKRPNPHNLKRQVMSCASGAVKTARETIDKAGKLDDAAKKKFARFDELCPTP